MDGSDSGWSSHRDGCASRRQSQADEQGWCVCLQALSDGALHSQGEAFSVGPFRKCPHRLTSVVSELVPGVISAGKDMSSSLV